MVSRTAYLEEKASADFQQLLEWGTIREHKGERIHKDLLLFYGAFPY